jgi:hypothetical protein
VSYFIFGFLLAMTLWRQRRNRIESKILGPSAAMFPYLKHKVIEWVPPPEITPFEMPDSPEQSQLEANENYILLQYRDKKVEELIEWRQWGVALKLVEEKIRAAQAVGDRKVEQIYKAYLDLIKPRIGRPLD